MNNTELEALLSQSMPTSLAQSIVQDQDVAI
jgi:hypothetical protein